MQRPHFERPRRRQHKARRHPRERAAARALIARQKDPVQTFAVVRPRGKQRYDVAVVGSQIRADNGDRAARRHRDRRATPFTVRVPPPAVWAVTMELTAPVTYPIPGTQCSARTSNVPVVGSTKLVVTPVSVPLRVL